MSTFTRAQTSELEPFIAKGQEGTHLGDVKTSRPQSTSRIKTALLNISFIFICTFITTAIMLSNGLCKIVDSNCHVDPHRINICSFTKSLIANLLLAFARSAIQYAPRKFIYVEDSPYVGTPSSTIEASWAALFRDANIRVTKDELASSGQNLSSIPVDSKDNRLAWLEMSHQLHCVVCHPAAPSKFANGTYIMFNRNIFEKQRTQNTITRISVNAKQRFCESTLVSFKFPNNKSGVTKGKPLVHVCYDVNNRD